MRILVVGSGGREHALAWKLAQEAEVLCAPGNPGIAQDVETVNVSPKDQDAIVKLALDRKVDLVVVGPEDPLIDGLGDKLRAAGLNVYGPNADGAQLEGSKAFSKSIMQAAGVPTAAFESFTDPKAAIAFVKARYAAGKAVAVKASGNALGKGVVVAETEADALKAVEAMMVRKEFGEAGETVVIEDRLVGREFSLLTIVGDQNFVSLPISQDHKRALDGDQGPNTGGMGTYSPCEWVSEALVRECETQMVAPTIAELKRRGISFRGTLFTGVMVQDGVPYCLEFNVRFGDPETQSVMVRLGAGFAQALYQAATGQVIEAPEVKPEASITVVIASKGYPGSYEKGKTISIGKLPDGVKLFHAASADKDGVMVTNGGRVFGLTALAPTLAEAKTLAYDSISKVEFEGASYRTDIGAHSGK